MKRLCFLAALFLLAVSVQAAESSFVYVESNLGTPGQNSVMGFRNYGSGSLTPLPGSPYSTGGTGVFDTSLQLGPFDSHHEIIVTAITAGCLP